MSIDPQAFSCLVIADESEEFPDALIYAGLLCRYTGWRLLMLRVIEPSDPAPWASITEEMRRQARDAAESLTQRFAAEAWAECGVTAEPVLREGDLKPELRKFLQEDTTIKLVVLAAATPPSSPGSLITQLGKTGGLSPRPVPVVVVPGALSRDEIRAIALPMAAAVSVESEKSRLRRSPRLLDPFRPKAHLSAMFIQTELTPNPRTLKFLPGRDVLGQGSREYADADAGLASPLATALFDVDGVERVYLGGDFITITKSEAIEWPHLKPHVLAAIMDHFTSGRPVLGDSAASTDETDEADIVYEDDAVGIVKEIKEIIDARVRPAVARDGGDITFHSWDHEHGVVRLNMRGSCAGCPSSTLTLKQGIENMLRHYVPEVLSVEQVV